MFLTNWRLQIPPNYAIEYTVLPLGGYNVVSEHEGCRILLTVPPREKYMRGQRLYYKLQCRMRNQRSIN